MSLDTYTFWILVAGALAGVGITIVAFVVPDMIAAVRHIAAHVQRRAHQK